MRVFSMLLSLITDKKKPSSLTSTSMCTAVNTAKSGTGAYMVPSSIHHIYSGINNILSVDVDENILAVSRKIVETGDLPKLQVVEKDGNWFTLNNAQLDLCRILEKDGICTKVKVDILPLSSVPVVVRGMMNVPEDKLKDNGDAAQSNSPDPSRTTVKGYCQLEQTEWGEDQDTDNVADSEADETGSESSDFADSDSECDWSDNDQESSEVDSTASDDDQSTDDERECLL